MKENSGPPQRFLVTTPGLSATRWLSFALASHPAVFVAHGKHPLDSVMRGEFLREKKIDDAESLTQGNLAADFYARESLDGIFDAYLELLPAARALGNVHTFTLEALMKKAGGEEALRGIHVINVLRHPVRYIASHTSLVRSSESYPLYPHYSEGMFSQALEQFPELLLLDCEDYRLFLAFAVSCLSVCNLAKDFVYPQFKSVQMEVLTREVTALQCFCEELTGLEYPAERLNEIIQGGAINQHRKHAVNEQAGCVWRGWATWQQDMARMMIPVGVLDKFEAEGYDVSVLRMDLSSATEAPLGNAREAVPSLADRLRELNPDHPWLADRDPARVASPEPPPILVEEGADGFNIVLYRGSYYALAQAIGPIDLSTTTAESLQTLQDDGQCLIAEDIYEARKWMASRSKPAFDEMDRLLSEGVAGHSKL